MAARVPSVSHGGAVVCAEFIGGWEWGGIYKRLQTLAWPDGDVDTTKGPHPSALLGWGPSVPGG